MRGTEHRAEEESRKQEEELSLPEARSIKHNAEWGRHRACPILVFSGLKSMDFVDGVDGVDGVDTDHSPPGLLPVVCGL